MQFKVAFPSDPTAHQHLRLDKQLGQGKFKVFLAKSATSNDQYALKIFSRDFSLRSLYSRESSIAAKLDHPHVVKYIPVHSHNFRMDIMLIEYIPNGDLFDFIMKGFLKDEKLIRTYFRQLIDGIEYLHNQGIAHLDLKLDNLLLDANYALKIIDFDQAHTVTESKLQSYGTTGYRAPEVINRTCENFLAADIYAAGVILFSCKTSEFPFEEPRDTKLEDAACFDTFTNDNERFWQEKAQQRGDHHFFNPDFRDLINGMLKKDPSKRFTIEDIRNSEWYKGSVYNKDELKNVIEGTAAKCSIESQSGGTC